MRTHGRHPGQRNSAARRISSQVAAETSTVRAASCFLIARDAADKFSSCSSPSISAPALGRDEVARSEKFAPGTQKMEAEVTLKKKTLAVCPSAGPKSQVGRP